MGTSSSYGGPTGRNPLLPPWADGVGGSPDGALPGGGDGPRPDSDGVPPPEMLPTPTLPPPIIPSVSWRAPKGIVTRIANGNTSASFRSASKSYVRAHGGSRIAARAASSGRATTRSLGGFLAGIVRNGVVEAAGTLGLRNMVGLDAQSLLAAFIDLLAPAGALLEEAIARKALIETIGDLFDRYDVEAGGPAALDRMDENGMHEIIVLSVTNYVNERFQQELVNCVERGSVSEHRANELIDEAKDFIAGIIEIDLEGIDLVSFDWEGEEGRRFVDDIYQTAYSLLGD
jgi:hypothetical protein